jgi:hypothetical protein
MDLNLLVIRSAIPEQLVEFHRLSGMVLNVIDMEMDHLIFQPN